MRKLIISLLVGIVAVAVFAGPVSDYAAGDLEKAKQQGWYDGHGYPYGYTPDKFCTKGEAVSLVVKQGEEVTIPMVSELAILLQTQINELAKQNVLLKLQSEQLKAQTESSLAKLAIKPWYGWSVDYQKTKASKDRIELETWLNLKWNELEIKPYLNYCDDPVYDKAIGIGTKVSYGN